MKHACACACACACAGAVVRHGADLALESEADAGDAGSIVAASFAGFCDNAPVAVWAEGLVAEARGGSWSQSSVDDEIGKIADELLASAAGAEQPRQIKQDRVRAGDIAELALPSLWYRERATHPEAAMQALPANAGNHWLDERHGRLCWMRFRRRSASCRRSC